MIAFQQNFGNYIHINFIFCRHKGRAVIVQQIPNYFTFWTLLAMNSQIINDCAETEPWLPTAGTDHGRRYVIKEALHKNLFHRDGWLWWQEFFLRNYSLIHCRITEEQQSQLVSILNRKEKKVTITENQFEAKYK